MALWPSWVRPKAAPSDELVTQLDAAQAEHAAACDALDVAQREFEDTGSEKAGKALLTARERITLSEAHLHRAEKLLADRKEAERQTELTRLRGEVAVLRAKSHAALAEERPFIEREAELLAEVFTVRERRWRVRMGANAWVRDINRLLIEMGEQPSETVIDAKPSPHEVAKLINDKIQLVPTHQQTGQQDPRRDLMSRVLPHADDYTLGGWRGEQVYHLADLEPTALTPKVRRAS